MWAARAAPLTSIEGGHTLRHDAPRGQGLVEYGLVIALVAVLAIAGLVVLGPALSAHLSTLAGSV